MDSTAQEIRQQEEQSTTNNTPEPADEVAGDGGKSGSSLPIPSVDKKLVAVIAVVAIAAIAWKLKQSSSSDGDGGLAEARDELDKTDRAKATPDEKTAAEDQIEVPQDPSQPLAGDDAVIEEFRKRGILSDRTEQ